MGFYNTERKLIVEIIEEAFIVLRYSNFYGDPHIWSLQGIHLFTILSFINCEKYPPSLLFLLMTLGPAFIVFGLTNDEFSDHFLSQIIVTYGRVPFFFYMLHLPLIFGLALFMAYLFNGMEAISLYMHHQVSFGYDLSVVYLVWCSVIIILYYPCRLYWKFKSKNKNKVLSYL